MPPQNSVAASPMGADLESSNADMLTTAGFTESDHCFEKCCNKSNCWWSWYGHSSASLYQVLPKGGWHPWNECTDPENCPLTQSGHGLVIDEPTKNLHVVAAEARLLRNDLAAANLQFVEAVARLASVNTRFERLTESLAKQVLDLSRRRPRPSMPSVDAPTVSAAPRTIGNGHDSSIGSKPRGRRSART